MSSHSSWRPSNRKARRSGCRLAWEVMERRRLLSTYVVNDTSDNASPGSLRWAILQVNSDTTLDTIAFDIQGAGAQTIQLSSPLPDVVNPVLIDGTTQGNYQGSPLVEINGTGLSAGSNGLVLSGGGSTVRGLALVGFSGSGIVLNSPGGNVIEGDYLGVEPGGTQALANGTGISIVGSPSNTIGGTSSASANIISGNTGDGILIQDAQAASTLNVVCGNLIGTAAGGTTALGNSLCGIEINGSASNLIGSTSAGPNVVAGNLGAGIEVDSGATGTTIQNNNVGVGLDGKTVVGNGGDGMLLDGAPQTQIGGTTTGQGNLIGGNQGNGINVEGDTSQLLVEGNFIGTDATGQLNLGNHQSGVRLASSSNTIGGSIAADGNIIDDNGTGSVGDGVLLVGNVNQDAILSNSIYMNAGLGINLGDGPTPNHAPGTPGPNNYQNYPVLSAVKTDGSTTTVTGTLSESPNTQYLIQCFASPTADQTGYGQGQTLTGSFNVQTDGNGNASFTVPIPAGVPAGSFVSATASDPAGNTSEFCLDVQAQGEINLFLTGAATPNPVLAGDNVTYSFSVANKGSIAAHEVEFTDQLPNGLTLVSDNCSPGYIVPTMNRTLVTANLGTIPAGSTGTVTIVVQTQAGSAGSITDSASVSSEETDPDPSNESVSLSTAVELAADVSVAMTASPDPVLLQGDVTYTITVSDLGPSTASNAIATLPLASTVAFVSASASTGTASFGSGAVTAELGDLGVNNTATVTVVVQALSVGQLTETATASSDNIDPNPANNSATTTTEVEAAADLAVAITASASEVADGIPFSYTVTVTNNGPSNDTGVSVNDTLPQGVAFVSASSGQGVTPTYSAGVVSLSLATLNAGASAAMTINANPTAPPGSLLTDSAAVSGQLLDPDPANNTATLVLPVMGVSDLQVTASAQPSSVYQGQDVTYTITATNAGPADEPDAVVTSQLPANLAFVSAATTQGATPTVNQNGLLTADLGLLPANGTPAVITIVAMPGAGSVGTLTTSFSIQGQNVDPNLSNNTAQVSINVGASTNLSIGIVPGGQRPYQLVDWTYTLVVSNPGLSNATGVTALAPVPPNAQFVSATSSQGSTPTEQGGILSANLGTIATGQTASITMVVEPIAVGSLSLAASVSGNEFDLDPAGEQASATVTVAPSVNMAVSLAPNVQTVMTGQPLSLTAVVSNLGPAPATNVNLDLPLASGLVFDSATSTQGSTGLQSGEFVAQIGEIDPGASATVIISVTPSLPGTVIQSASVTADENQLDPANDTASATFTALESAGLLGFAAASYAVPETAGQAQLSVVRTDGSLGAVSVNFQTVAVNATPGLDYVPTSGTLVFASGQTSGTVQIPVLEDPWDNHDEYVNVVLSAPTGGARLGAVATASLRIIDVDPDVTPPEVSQLVWSGTSRSITSVTISFTAPLDPTCAVNPSNFTLINLAAGGQRVALGTPRYNAEYNAANFSVTLVPSAPLASGNYYEVVVQGSGPGAVCDIAGNMLDGAGNGIAGSNYVATFAQGTKLQYVDSSGNRVTLTLTGAGYLEQVRDQAGDGVVLDVVGEVPHRTTLSGSVHKTKGSSGRTELGVINGLGQFGDVRVLLTSPPFFVRQFPFSRRGKGVL